MALRLALDTHRYVDFARGVDVVVELLVLRVRIGRRGRRTIVWPNGVDLDPDMLYEAARGRPASLSA